MLATLRFVNFDDIIFAVNHVDYPKGEMKMAISYNKMKKRLIDLEMKPKDLKEKAEVSQNVMAKINKNEPISVESLEKICRSLQCDIGDVMEFVPEGGDNK